MQKNGIAKYGIQVKLVIISVYQNFLLFFNNENFNSNIEQFLYLCNRTIWMQLY